MAKNRVIGNNNTIPWHIPEDLHYFKTTTMGHGLIMGRKTWESIGHALVGRTNVVISKNPKYKAKGCILATSIEYGIKLATQRHHEIFIIGGEEIYTAALPLAHNIFITLLERNVPGNTFFPDLPENKYTLQKEVKHHWGEPLTLQHFTRKP